MSGLIGALEQAAVENPLDTISKDETECEITKFCSFCSILHNKKLNSVAVFTLIVKNNIYKKVFMKLVQIDNDREAFILFLKYNPNLCRSKVVREVLKS